MHICDRLQTPSHSTLAAWAARAPWAFFNEHDASSTYVKQLVPHMQLMAAATEFAFRDNPHGAPTREQAEALLVSVWAMVVGYVAGNTFFWNALGRKPGAARDRVVREMVGALAKGLTLA
jgi:hypothetical protein